METWDKPISSSCRDYYRHPSFSSTDLLDQIYRSIDDSPSLDSTTKKQQRYTSLHEDREASPDKLVFRLRLIATDFDRSKRMTTATTADSNTSSSDSSGFSSSEYDSFYRHSRSSASPPPPPKPIRTSAEKPTGKQDLGGFLRTKSKALKIYADLKKVKQPRVITVYGIVLRDVLISVVFIQVMPEQNSVV